MEAPWERDTMARGPVQGRGRQPEQAVPVAAAGLWGYNGVTFRHPRVWPGPRLEPGPAVEGALVAAEAFEDATW